MYHRKYCAATSAFLKELQGEQRVPTCDVQTLLKTTKTNVCTNHAKTRSSRRRPNSSPVPRARLICGTKLASGDRISPFHMGTTGPGAADVPAEGYVRYTR